MRTHSWQSVSLNLNCVRSISVIYFETEIPNLVCGYTLGRRVSHTVSGVIVILTLSSDPSSRKIVSRAYILYCFKVGIVDTCKGASVQLGHFELDLWQISYIIGGRNPTFRAWIQLGVVECHTLFIDHCVSFIKTYCLWGYFINL